MKAGVVGIKRKVENRTEQCLEVESTEARTYNNPQRESIGVSGRRRVFSKLVLSMKKLLGFEMKAMCVELTNIVICKIWS